MNLFKCKNISTGLDGQFLQNRRSSGALFLGTAILALSFLIPTASFAQAVTNLTETLVEEASDISEVCASNRTISVKEAFQACPGAIGAVSGLPVFIKLNKNEPVSDNGIGQMNLCVSEERFENADLQKANDLVEAIDSQILNPVFGWASGFKNAQGLYHVFQPDEMKKIACVLDQAVSLAESIDPNSLSASEQGERRSLLKWVSNQAEAVRRAFPSRYFSLVGGYVSPYVPHGSLAGDSLSTPLSSFVGFPNNLRPVASTVDDLEKFSDYLTGEAEVKNTLRDLSMQGVALGYSGHVMQLTPNIEQISATVGGPDWGGGPFNTTFFHSLIANIPYPGFLYTAFNMDGQIDDMVSNGIIPEGDANTPGTGEYYKAQHADIYNTMIRPTAAQFNEDINPGGFYYEAARNGDDNAGLDHILNNGATEADKDVGRDLYDVVLAARTTYGADDGVFCIRRTEPEPNGGCTTPQAGCWTPTHEPYEYFKNTDASLSLSGKIQQCAEDYVGWFQEIQNYWKKQYEIEYNNGVAFADLAELYTDINDKFAPKEGIDWTCTEHFKKITGVATQSEPPSYVLFTSEAECEGAQTGEALGNRALKNGGDGPLDDPRFASLSFGADGDRTPDEYGNTKPTTKMYQTMVGTYSPQIQVIQNILVPVLFSDAVIALTAQAPVLTPDDHVTPPLQPGAYVAGYEFRGGDRGANASLEWNALGDKVAPFVFDTRNPERIEFKHKPTVLDGELANTGISGVLLHEMMPGHGIQAPLAESDRLANSPQWGYVRAGRSGFGAYQTAIQLEGWAAYTEMLGFTEPSLGVFNKIENGQLTSVGDPVANLLNSQLSARLPGRLLVGPGINIGGMSLSEAVENFNAVTGFKDSGAASNLAVSRAFNWPGQIMGYGLGALALTGLREQAKSACATVYPDPGTNPDFNKGFHDALLLGDVNAATTIADYETAVNKFIADSCQ